MKKIMAPTDTAYGTLNVKVSGHDMTVVEHYSQYIHNFCNRLGIKVSEWWGCSKLQSSYTPESLTDFTVICHHSNHSVCKISIKMWKITVSQSDVFSTVEEMLRWENICTRMLFVASFSYALPTKSMEVLLMQEQGTKMYVDATLKTHERVVQVKRSLYLPRSPSALVRPDYWSVLFIHVCSWALWTLPCVPFSWTCFLRISQREFSCLWRRWVSVTTASQQQSVESCDYFKSNNPSCPCFFSQHTEADFQARFKARPEMEGLMAQMKY